MSAGGYGALRSAVGDCLTRGAAWALRYLPARRRGVVVAETLAGLPDEEALRVTESLALVRLLDYPRAPVRLRVTSRVEYRGRLASCAKEPWTVEWIEGHVRQGDVVYDIGANVGAYALVAAHATGREGGVVAFEPAFATFAALCQNIILNGCEDTVVPLPIALTARTGLVGFHYRTLTPGAGLHALGAPRGTGRSEEPAYRQVLLAYALDDLLGAFDLPRPNHLKIDVDGPELDVVRGALATLGDPAVRSILVEVNEDDRESDQALVRLVESCGFELRSRVRRPPKEGVARPFSYCTFARGV